MGGRLGWWHTGLAAAYHSSPQLMYCVSQLISADQELVLTDCFSTTEEFPCCKDIGILMRKIGCFSTTEEFPVVRILGYL